MSKERFERLRESVIEAGQILRGNRQPSREFTYEIELTESGKSRQTDWAICLTSDEDALVPLKLYRVKFSTAGHASVVDEEGEKLVCPAKWFLRVRLAPEVKQQVADLAS
jgi:hypothetical protein